MFLISYDFFYSSLSFYFYAESFGGFGKDGSGHGSVTESGGKIDFQKRQVHKIQTRANPENHGFAQVQSFVFQQVGRHAVFAVRRLVVGEVQFGGIVHLFSVKIL